MRLTVRDKSGERRGHHAAIAMHLPRYAGIPYTVTLLLTTCQPLPDCVELDDESRTNPAALVETTATNAKVSIVVLIPGR